MGRSLASADVCPPPAPFAYQLLFQVWRTCGSWMPCLSACSSRKSNMYLMASGRAEPRWAVLKMVSNRSSTNFCSVPCGEEKEAEGPVRMETWHQPVLDSSWHSLMQVPHYPHVPWQPRPRRPFSPSPTFMDSRRVR